MCTGLHNYPGGYRGTLNSEGRKGLAVRCELRYDPRGIAGKRVGVSARLCWLNGSGNPWFVARRRHKKHVNEKTSPRGVGCWGGGRKTSLVG